MNIIRKGFLITAAAATLALGGASGAQAHALADAILSISNLRLLDSQGNRFTPGDFSALSMETSRLAAVSLGGPDAHVSLGGPVCAGTCLGSPFGPAPIANRFDPIQPSLLTSLPAETFAHGDTEHSGSALGVSGLNADTRALASVIDRPRQALAHGETATFIVFSLGTDGSMTIAFDAEAHTLAHLPVAAPGIADASVSLRITIFDLETGISALQFAPEEFNESAHVRREGVPGTTRYDYSEFLTATSSSLNAGTTYVLAIAQSSSSSAAEEGEVPEPATLPILATGLLAMSLASRRRRS